MTEKIASEMERARKMHRFCADQLAGEYPDDSRRLLFSAFMSLAMSHHEAILFLSEHKRFASSAFALFRSLIEATYRGLFVAYLATPEQVTKIKDGGKPYPEFNTLTAKLDELFKTDMFSQYGGEAWKTLNGLTHGGVEQLSNRVSADAGFGSHFDDADVASMLASSTSALVRMVIQFLNGMERLDSSHAVSIKFIEFYPVPKPTA